MQAFLSARLMRSNTAMADEPLYLYAGHLVWAHWLHGAPLPNYPAYFSGAPVLYPPVAAVADHFGGLFGARCLSLAFMLTATGTLWTTASRLYGRTAAVIGCVLFLCIGSTQYLGTLATYDAMSLCLLSVAAYCVVRAGDADEGSRWWVAGAVLLALANATKYASALWDPAVIALAGLVYYRAGGVRVKAAICRAAAVAAVAIGLEVLGVAAGGEMYIVGIGLTTTNRPEDGTAASLVLRDSWDWVGVVLVLAAAAVLFTVRRTRRQELGIIAALFAAAAAAPGNQARIHVVTSLQKHVDFGAWFGCIAAGYLVTAVASIARRGLLRIVAAAVAAGAIVAFAAPPGYAQAPGYIQNWPSSVNLIPALRPLTHRGTERYLVENYEVPAYYLRTDISVSQWQETWYFLYHDPATGQNLSLVPAFEAAIEAHYFTLIVLNYRATTAIDQQIVGFLQACANECGYKLIEQIPFANTTGHYDIWQLQGAQS
ncbi:glycosyltransferase family 39 protein [Actinospica sp. MGRD01-02]|uniref:Glycosyltransferase family 39 protein n=1 Tax=Actinospica acidithermotolerans TaxID=2828514 RepID=A0A941E9T6_9ACTN|nr:glycosyltransferase family 39 protein [Actinospica acidithermotolerans]MBR7826240.1 glycosyltransferase family 39 protein [Actinospica acidithermotolerans]